MFILKGAAGLYCDREVDAAALRSPLTLRGCCNWLRCCVRKRVGLCGNEVGILQGGRTGETGSQLPHTPDHRENQTERD